MKNVLIALSLAGLTACATSNTSNSEPMQPSKTIQALQSNSQHDFFETAASAGMLEIEAGKLAQTMGTHPEIKKYAATMVADHEKAAAELKKLADKKGVKLPTAMLERHQMMYDGLKGNDKGKSFDNEYRLKMIASHKEAVSLFDQAANKAEDADVKAFAAKTLPTLQHHGAMANDLPKS